MITAAVLIRNEEKNLHRCLSALSWCDEKLVIDDGSTDGSVAVARKLGWQVFKHPLDGDFAAQHNFALTKARGDWVFFVDADEVVTPELRREIEMVLSDHHDVQGYFLARLDFFWSKALRHGETATGRFLRLGRKSAGKWVRPVHETWVIAGNTETLRQPLLHFPHPTIRDFVSSINKYTDIDEKELMQEGKQFSYFRFIANPVGKFLYNYFFLGGFLDGFPGFIMAFMMSLHSLIVRVKTYPAASPAVRL